MHQRIKFILFWIDTRHVSDGLSVHHQTFKTVHTATGICQIDTADCLTIRSSRICIQQQAFVKQILLTAWPSGVQEFTYSNRHMSNRYCWLLDHQEFKNLHTATGICQRDTAVCLTIRSSRLYIQQQAYVKQILLTAWPSGVQEFTYSNRHLSNRYCWLLDHQEFKNLHTAADIFNNNNIY